MLINFIDATNDANHYTKSPPTTTTGVVVTTVERQMLTRTHEVGAIAAIIKDDAKHTFQTVDYGDLRDRYRLRTTINTY